MARIFDTKIKIETATVELLNSLLYKECVIENTSKFGYVTRFIVSSTLWADVYTGSGEIIVVDARELLYENK